MTHLWRLASGLAVFLMALFFSASLILNLTLGDRPLPGFIYHVLVPVVACVVLFLSFAGSYLLLSDARNSRWPIVKS
jgi:hypothetical protein